MATKKTTNNTVDASSDAAKKLTTSLRGKSFVGTVVSAKAAKTVSVAWERRKYVPKYERYEKRRSKVAAHNDIGAKEGDTVRIQECRPLSKTKHFIVTEIIGGTQE